MCKARCPAGLPEMPEEFRAQVELAVCVSRAAACMQHRFLQGEASGVGLRAGREVPGWGRGGREEEPDCVFGR